MNLLLLEEQDFISSDVVRISGRRHQQLHTVIKAQPGKLCRAGVLGGMRGHAEVLEITESGIASVNYKDTEHYIVTKRFMDAPEKMVESLLGE